MDRDLYKIVTPSSGTKRPPAKRVALFYGQRPLNQLTISMTFKILLSHPSASVYQR